MSEVMTVTQIKEFPKTAEAHLDGLSNQNKTLKKANAELVKETEIAHSLNGILIKSNAELLKTVREAARCIDLNTHEKISGDKYRAIADKYEEK